MFFVQAEPFERRYSQSQESGGMGAGGDQDDNKISEREKEIIAATWNQIKDTSGDKAAAPRTPASSPVCSRSCATRRTRCPIA
jgi:hypothetical protein